MNKVVTNTLVVIIGILSIVFLGGIFFGIYYQTAPAQKYSEPRNDVRTLHIENEPKNDVRLTLTEKEAQVIAEQTCIKGGGTLSSGGTYNSSSKTWWFDANLNATHKGCNPACVVSEETKTAEINWRCTGLVLSDQSDSEVSQKDTASISENVESVQEKYADITIGSADFRVEIVRTPEQSRRGLGGRESLLPDTGMWFDFGSKNRWGIWMKDMKFPIDIVWLNENFEIVTLTERVSPETYPKVFYPSSDASHVLEFSSGTVEKYHIEVGNRAFVK